MDAVQAIGNRDYKRRVRFGPSQELYPLAQSVNQMAEKVERQFLGISGEKHRLEAVFDGMQEGVMVLDSRGRIQSINRALAEMVGNPADPAGRRPMELIMSLELQEVCDRMLSSPEAVRALPGKLQIELGEGRIYDVTMVKFEDAKGGMGSILVFHDISELKRLERVRQDFVANVSHELRTPLTSIKGYTETLLATDEPDRQTLSSFLPIILRNTNHMAKMVEDLLHLARLETGKTPIKISTLNASDSLMAAWRACAPLAQSKAISLINELPEEGVFVSADFDQMVQVFRNLLENSIRHSPDGASLTVGSLVQGDTVRFSIKDQGPGVPKYYQQRIFERFFRVERHGGTESGATGLGLAICRHIVKNHGGSIWVQSPNPGEVTGSTFHFTLHKANPNNGDAWQPPA
jgi:two-component system phosphate regulon sensor histidine kinase PhoR